MLLLLSPAKTLDETPLTKDVTATQPEFLKEACMLIEILQSYSHEDIASLMHVSDAIAALNVARYQSFTLPLNKDNAKPALFSFKGDVYKPIEADTYSDAQLEFAQHHVRILSGLYGILRPLDYLYPYRLEMGTALPNSTGKNLYAFWGDKITKAINASLVCSTNNIVLNVASTEYSKVVQPKYITGRYITVNFKERKGDDYKTIGIHAKKARGLFADFVIKNTIDAIEDIKEFNEAQYYYSPALSNESIITFIRDCV